MKDKAKLVSDETIEKIKEKIKKKLGEVIDPEIGIDIVNLGLIYEIKIERDLSKATVKMTATTPMCPLLGEMLSEVEEKLSQIEEVEEIAVELVWEPKWGPEMMSKEAKEMLGFD